MRSLIALLAAGAVVIAPAAVAQTQRLQSLNPRDVQEAARQHPELVAEFGGAETGPRAAFVEGVGRRMAAFSGTALLTQVPARLGWELRFVLAGALRILDRLQSLDHDVAARRPKLGWRDAPALVAKAAVLTRRQAARG